MGEEYVKEYDAAVRRQEGLSEIHSKAEDDVKRGRDAPIRETFEGLEKKRVGIRTLDYYDTHAKEFFRTTVDVEFVLMQERFLSKLKEGSRILDFGCGSGRDTKYFLERGYVVDAMDGSARLCELASEHAGIEVKNMFFQELAEVDKYDGIWACSSILHLPVDELADVMRKMAVALRANGIIYTSFKYGAFSGERNGRFFTDMTEESFAKFLSGIEGLEVEEQWTTSDVRPGRGEEKWLNLILRKK